MNKKFDVDYLNFILVNNISTSTTSNIYFGNIKSNKIFDLKIEYKNTLKKYDIIPLINSILQFNTLQFNVNDITKYYYEDKIHILKKNIKNKDILAQQISLKKKLNNFYLLDDEIDKCIIFNSIENISSVYFPSIKQYNHKENFILLEWVIENDICIEVCLYSSYLTISIKIDLIENNKCPKNKLIMITKLTNNLNTIIQFLKNNVEE